MKTQTVKARIINESGRDISKELTELIAKLYKEGKLKL
ncbi:hypothetical protein SAMN05444401_3586 [Clostridium amylolyticum]|uniref:Uncharacterized protein n=1 Tax=Clostridium amylolyticum TaxID=1121298 RepID=A0A1M6L2I4_9CLOT|nr:hypothetical protein SAMN05444401_3586 [Clostridium amylolyticum]